MRGISSAIGRSSCRVWTTIPPLPLRFPRSERAWRNDTVLIGFETVAYGNPSFGAGGGVWPRRKRTILGHLISVVRSSARWLSNSGRSRITIAGGFGRFEAISTADSGSLANTHVAPSESNSVRRRARVIGLSSMQSAISPLSSRPAKGGAVTSAGRWAASVMMAIVKVDPLPSVLSTRMSPFISWQSLWQIARPSPVPPYLRVVDESTWLNALKSRSIRSGGMPMPVSCTVISRRIRPAGVARTEASSGILRTWMEMLPDGVNFMALLTRFTMIWRRRVTSPTIHGGTSGSTW